MVMILSVLGKRQTGLHSCYWNKLLLHRKRNIAGMILMGKESQREANRKGRRKNSKKGYILSTLP
jgi:hypothetical protein